MFFGSCVTHASASGHCCLVVTCWERPYLLDLVCYMLIVFVTFPRGILGQVWYLIVSFPNLCFPFYFLAMLVETGQSSTAYSCRGRPRL